MGWVGYMVHLTKTCDAARPRLIVRARAMPANTHEAGRTGAIHDALAAKGMAPSEHLADSGWVGGAPIVAARERHGAGFVGPPRPDLSWQAREGSAFVADDFVVDRENHRVRCPEGRDLHHLGGAHRQDLRTIPCPRRLQPEGLPAVRLALPRAARARSRRLLLMPRAPSTRPSRRPEHG